MRKKDETLRDTLLSCARELARREGTGSINIRQLAVQAGIATGTVYNYFPSKEEVMLALTEEFWRDSFQEMRTVGEGKAFTEQLRDIYHFMHLRLDDSAMALMQSLRGVKSTGYQRMASIQASLKAELLRRLTSDPSIQPTLWTETFTPERLVSFVLMNLLASLRQKADTIDYFLDILNRILN